MRIIFLFLFTGITSIFAIDGNSQVMKVSINKDATALKNILSDIEKQTNYLFVYEKNEIDVGRNVTVKANDIPVAEVLSHIFNETDIVYAMEGEYIMLMKKSMESTGQQQNGKKITGTVTDAAGDPVLGASVAVKGKTIGTTTDGSGKFTLSVSPDDKLIISYLGYESQEIAVGNQTSFEIALQEDVQALDEVVVVGYGTVRKQAVSGAVAVANLETFKNVPSNNILDQLKGAIPGLNISPVTNAGSTPNILIRGQNTTADNYPLIVVDGAIFAASIADISPYDIESFTVLKDASAAAVYGSRSANGVILIETKRGARKEGKPVFNANLNYGISNQLKAVKIFEGDAYLQRILDIRELNGQEADPAKITFYMQEEERKNYEATPDHRPTMPNPLDYFISQGYNRNLNLSVANRTDKTRYYISVSSIDQQALLLNDKYKYLSGRINLDSDIAKWLNIGVKAFYAFRDESGSSQRPGNMSLLSPWATLQNPDGTYPFAPQTTTSVQNPYWIMATSDLKTRHDLNGIFTATVKAPWVEGLSLVSTMSNTLHWQQNNLFYDKQTVEGSSANGRGSRNAASAYIVLWDNMLKYSRTFSEKHYVDVTALISQEKYSDQHTLASARDFEDTSLGDYRLSDGKIQTVDTGGNGSEALGLMARATYTFDNKYSITGTIRRDGYSAFSKNKKFGTFPSVGVNWNVSRESFMKAVPAIDNLAIRATYGTNGNQSIGRYQTLARVSTDKYIYAGSTGYVITQYISSLAANNLSWESTTGLNLGIDFGVLKNRISGAIDIYRTRTNDMIFWMNLPETSGMSGIYSNVGEIQNRGVEVMLNTVNIKHNDFKWSSAVAFSLNRNKLAYIFDKNGKEEDLISAGYFMGESLGMIYDYRVTGMYQQKDVDGGTIMTGYRPGEYILEDLDGDGKITSDKDRQKLGNSKENFRWSFTNTFDYKGFSLMVYLYSIWGGNGYYMSGSNTPHFHGYANRTDVNVTAYDYWTPRNTGAFFPRPDYGMTGATKSKKYIDRSFIKLQKISLTYDLGRWLKPYKINSLLLGVSADNILTYAPHWMGLDPETDQGLSGEAPSIRTYNFSLSINF